MFCLYTLTLARPGLAKIQMLTAICSIVKLITWNKVNLSHLYRGIWGWGGQGNWTSWKWVLEPTRCWRRRQCWKRRIQVRFREIFWPGAHFCSLIRFTLLGSGAEWPRLFFSLLQMNTWFGPWVKKCHIGLSEKLPKRHFLTHAWKSKFFWSKCIPLK